MDFSQFLSRVTSSKDDQPTGIPGGPEPRRPPQDASDVRPSQPAAAPASMQHHQPSPPQPVNQQPAPRPMPSGAGQLARAGSARSVAAHLKHSMSIPSTEDISDSKASSGVLLDGAHAKLALDDWPAALTPSQSSSVAMYKRAFEFGAGNLVGTTANLVLYTVRGGKLRVLMRHEKRRALLKGHTANILDFCVSPCDDSVIGTLSADGTVRWWSIDYKQPDAGDDIPWRLLAILRLPDEAQMAMLQPPFPFLRPHPTSPTKFLVGAGSTVYVCDRDGADDGQRDPSAAFLGTVRHVLELQEGVDDACVLPTQQQVAVVTKTGGVTIFDSNGKRLRTLPAQAPSVSAGRLTGNRVFWRRLGGVPDDVQADVLVLCSSEGTHMSWWNTQQWSVMATLQLTGLTSPSSLLDVHEDLDHHRLLVNHMAMDSTGTLLLLAYTIVDLETGDVAAVQGADGVLVVHLRVGVNKTAGSGKLSVDPARCRFDFVQRFATSRAVSLSARSTFKAHAPASTTVPRVPDLLSFLVAHTSRVEEYNVKTKSLWPYNAATELQPVMVQEDSKASTPSPPPQQDPPAPSAAVAPHTTTAPSASAKSPAAPASPSAADSVAQRSASPAQTAPPTRQRVPARDDTDSAPSQPREVPKRQSDASSAATRTASSPQPEQRKPESATERSTPPTTPTRSVSGSRTTSAHADTPRPRPASGSSVGVTGSTCGTGGNDPRTRQEASLLRRLDLLFAKHYAVMVNNAQKERVQREQAEAQRLRTLLESISQTVNTTVPERIAREVQQQLVSGAMQQLVNNAVSQATTRVVQTEVLPAVHQSISQEVSRALGKQAMQGQLRDVTDQLSAQVEKKMTSSFKSNFKSILVPVVQDMTRNLFAQIHEAVQGALSQIDQREQAAQATLDQLKAQVAALAEQTTQLQQSVQSIVEHKQVAAASASPGQDVRTRVDALIAQEDFNTAFETVLGAGDLSLLLWLCNRLDPELLFSTDVDSHKLGAHILLSLIQQLSFDLKTDTLLKLTWLHEALLVMDVNDGLVAGHIGPVYSQALTNVQELFTTLSSKPKDAMWSMCRVVKQLLRSNVSVTPSNANSTGNAPSTGAAY